MSKLVKCPHCGKEVAWIEQESFKPFCSQRCKLIDFGEWADEKNSIPGESASPDEIDSDQYLQ